MRSNLVSRVFRSIGFPVTSAYRAGVIGHPISHSLSPEIFTFLSVALNLPVLYQKIDCDPSQLGVQIQEAQRQQKSQNPSPFIGLNVTLPHKESVLPWLSQVSPEVTLIGAVNVIHFTQEDSCGYNTDTQGVRETLREQEFQVHEKKALVFGAGGAAKAAIYTLAEMGIGHIVLCNRSRERAQKVCLKFSETFPSTQFTIPDPDEISKLEQEIDLCLNATPLGMMMGITGFNTGKGVLPSPTFFADLLPELLKLLNPNALVFDMVYRPENTPFLQSASALGFKTVGGLDMLVWQALATWEIWFGVIPNKQELKQHLKSHLKKVMK